MPEVAVPAPASRNKPVIEDKDQKANKSIQEALRNDEIIYNAFTLGLQMVELKSRIQIALVEPRHFNLRLVSIWRALFNKIAVLHVKTFPESATTRTLYEPPSEEALPYLYPPESDYANVGISGSGSNGLPILKDFKLFDVTRRAINCLTILYIDQSDSLRPDTIKNYQTHLVNSILEAATDPGAGGGDVRCEECTLNIDEKEHLQALEALPLAEKNHQKAIAILTERTVKFLSAWDGYLRENYYMGGRIPDDDTELIAYEAGRSISMLSWGITLQTVPIELKHKQLPAKTKELLIKAWTFVFRDSEIIRLQHQINAMSSALDEVYYLKHPEVKRHNQEETLVEVDPDKPYHIISAVKQSIEYWHRSVKWMYSSKNSENADNKPVEEFMDRSSAMRMALIEQADIWKTLLTGQQSLRAYKMESITYKLMQDLTEEIQKNLRTDFKGSMQQAEKLMNEVTAEVKDAIRIAGDFAKSGLDQMYQTYKGLFWIIISVVSVIVILFITYFVLSLRHPELFVGASGGAGILGVITAIMGYFQIGKIKSQQKAGIEREQETARIKVDSQAASGNASVTKTENNDGSIIGKMQGVARETGKAILEGLEKAYTQIRIELTGLKFSASVSYPLIEFFVMKCDIKSDEAFLTEIIWNGKDRNEEIKRIASAAFGSLAIFISPSATADDTKASPKNEKSLG